MARCPNCGGQISWDAADCTACSAVFGANSAWAPIGESHEEREKLAQRFAGVPSPVPSRDPSNPYAPPQSAVAPALSPAEEGRTAWVWVITILYGVSTLWSLVSLYLIATNRIPMDDATRAYWQHQSIFDYTISVLNSALSLIALAFFFFMRVRAIAYMLAALVVSVIGTVYQLAAKNIAAVLAGPGLIGLAIGFLLWLAVIWYANRLRKAGRLR